MPEISVNFHNDDYVTRYFVSYLSRAHVKQNILQPELISILPTFYLEYEETNFPRTGLHTLHTIFYRIRW